MNKYFWNTLAGLLNASEAIVMGMITTRVTGIADAGILTLAFALGNLFVCIGKWGTRTVQVTTTEIFQFKEFKVSRIISIGIMMIITAVYIIVCSISGDYAIQKIIALFSMCLIYAVEAYEDIYWGKYQRMGYIETGAKIFICRWTVIITVYTIFLCTIKNIALALVIALFFSVITEFVCIKKTNFRFTEEKLMDGSNNERKTYKYAKNILLMCAPLMIAAFMQFFMINAPKMFIDGMLDEKAVAIYGFIAMPVFAIDLLSGFIYNPQLTDLAKEYRDREIDKFFLRIMKQLGAIFILMVILIFLAWVVGIPILSCLYAVDLSAYKAELLVLLAGGTFMAIALYIGVVLTVESKQKDIMFSSIIVSVLSVPIYIFLINKKGIMGASISFLILMVLFSIFNICFLIYHSLKLEKSR